MYISSHNELVRQGGNIHNKIKYILRSSTNKEQVRIILVHWETTFLLLFAHNFRGWSSNFANGERQGAAFPNFFSKRCNLAWNLTSLCLSLNFQQFQEAQCMKMTCNSTFRGQASIHVLKSVAFTHHAVCHVENLSEVSTLYCWESLYFSCSTCTITTWV